MKKLPSVSIIIPTYNRKEVLEPALLSLNKVDYPRDRLEVVVVSDGSTDGTDQMVKLINSNLNYQFKYFKNPKRGISYTKNTAIKKSKGEIIVSTDDDCLFEKNWLKLLVSPFSKPTIGAVGGPDRAIKNQTIMAKSIDYAFSSFLGSGGIHGRPLPFKNIALGRAYPVGCNMAITRRAINTVGLFNEKLAPGEDTDLDYRIEKAGFLLGYVPQAFVWHRPRNNLQNFLPYSYKRGAARAEMVRRHPQKAELIYFIPGLMVISFIILVILAMFYPIFLKILITSVVLYLTLLLLAGLLAARENRQKVYLLTVPLLIFFQHSMHGIGLLTGLINIWLKDNET